MKTMIVLTSFFLPRIVVYLSRVPEATEVFKTPVLSFPSQEPMPDEDEVVVPVPKKEPVPEPPSRLEMPKLPSTDPMSEVDWPIRLCKIPPSCVCCGVLLPEPPVRQEKSPLPPPPSNATMRTTIRIVFQFRHPDALAEPPEELEEPDEDDEEPVRRSVRIPRSSGFPLPLGRFVCPGVPEPPCPFVHGVPEGRLPVPLGLAVPEDGVPCPKGRLPVPELFELP